jgi:uncharacterized membrane protein
MITATTTASETTASPAKQILQHQEIKRQDYEKPAARQRGKNYKITIYTAAGIAGAIALAGFIISGGLLPNANVNRSIPAGIEPGLYMGM